MSGSTTLSTATKQTSGGTKRGSFNPDFFLLSGSADVAVMETKADDDDPALDAGKFKYAMDHFGTANTLLARKRKKKPRYYFQFVSPTDCNRFIEALCDQETASFVSTFQGSLKA